MQVLGEKLILAANGISGLATCALRPSSIYGEYDTLMLPTLVKKAQEGKMKFRFGACFQDWTYAGNIAHACILVSHARLLCEHKGTFTLPRVDPVQCEGHLTMLAGCIGCSLPAW